MNFTVTIETLMTDFGWSQKDLAKQAGLTTQNLSQLINDHRSWNMNNLTKVAEAFGFTLWQLVKMAEESDGKGE